MSAMDTSITTSGGDGRTRCLCGQNDDQEGFMVQCERCLVWQHAECVGITEAEADAQEKYYCEKCAPADPIHKRRQTDPAVLGAKRRAQAQAKSEKKRKRSRKEPRASPDPFDAMDEESIREDKPLSREERKMKALMESIAKMEERERSKQQAAGKVPPPVAVPSKSKSKGDDNGSDVYPSPVPNAAASSSSGRGGVDRSYAQHQLSHHHTFRKPPATTEPARIDITRLHLRHLSPMYLGKTKWILQMHYDQRRRGSLQDHTLPMNKRVLETYAPTHSTAAGAAGASSSSSASVAASSAAVAAAAASAAATSSATAMSAAAPAPTHTQSRGHSQTMGHHKLGGAYASPLPGTSSASPYSTAVPTSSASTSRWGSTAAAAAAVAAAAANVTAGMNGQHRSASPSPSNHYAAPQGSPSASYRAPVPLSSNSSGGAYGGSMSAQSPRVSDGMDRGGYKPQPQYGRADSRPGAPSPRSASSGPVGGGGSGAGFGSMGGGNRGAGAGGYGSSSPKRNDSGAWPPGPPPGGAGGRTGFGASRDGGSGTGNTPGRNFGSASKPWMNNSNRGGRGRMGGYGGR